MLTKNDLQNFSFLSIGRILRIFVAAFAGIFYLKALGPEQYSTVQYIFMIFAIAFPLVEFGSNEVVQEIIQKNESNTRHFLDTLVFKFLNGAFAITLIIFYMELFQEDTEYQTFYYYFLPYLLFLSLNMGVYPYKYFLKVKQIAAIETIAILITTSLKVLALSQNGGVKQFLILSTLEEAFYMVYYNYGHWAELRRSRLSLDSILNRYKCGLVPFLSEIVFALDKFLPALLLANILSDNQYTVLIMAIAIIEYINIFSNSLSAAFFPRMLKERLEAYRYFYLFPVIGLATAIFINLFGADLILYILGTKFSGSVELLKLLSWSLVYQFSRTFLFRLFYTLNKSHLFLIFSVINIFSIWLIAFYSKSHLFAYAIASISSPIILFSVFLLVSKSFRGAFSKAVEKVN